MFINKQILVFILLFLSLISGSQTCDLQLKGIVKDDDNSEHLGFAVVKLLSPEKIIQTNEKGEFVFENLCKGKYNLLIRIRHSSPLCLYLPMTAFEPWISDVGRSANCPKYNSIFDL